MNALKHRAEFQALLSHLRLSESAKQILDATKLVLLVGPTSAGRNTILAELVKSGSYYYIVSDTTREMRTKDGSVIEQNGREYWFRQEDDILKDIRAGEFLEAAIIHEQQVSGISIREIDKAHEAGKIAITDVEPHGAAWIHDLKQDVKVIFVVPPAFDEWMTRLKARSDLPEDEIRRRLETAAKEMQTALSSDFYTFVVNDDLREAITDVDEIAKHGSDQAKNMAGRNVTETLLAAIRTYLASDTM